MLGNRYLRRIRTSLVGGDCSDGNLEPQESLARETPVARRRPPASCEQGRAARGGRRADRRRFAVEHAARVGKGKRSACRGELEDRARPALSHSRHGEVEGRRPPAGPGRDSPASPRCRAAIQTDAEGIAVVEGLPPRKHVLEVRADGYAAQTVAVAATAPGSTADLGFALAPGGRIRGTVRDAGGRPMAQVGVTLQERLVRLELGAPTRRRHDRRARPVPIRQSAAG